MVEILDSIDELSEAVAAYIIDLSAKAVADHGKFYVALAGGSTPRKLYDLLATDRHKNAMDWQAWEVFFSDERLVPLDSADSNYNLANSSLLSQVPIPSEQIHPVPTNRPADQAASAYADEVIKTFGDNELPRFDLILLGLGSDGHTASLFPGKPALAATERLVVASAPGVLPPPVDRITFTFPLINAAHNVAFLAAGKDKSEMVAKALRGKDIPASSVKPNNGKVIWFIDKPAAGK